MAMTDTAAEKAASPPPLAPNLSGLLGLGWRLAIDIIRYDGSRSLAALALMVVGGVLEGAGLLILVPILSVAMGSMGPGHGSELILSALTALGADTKVQRLMVLLAGFCVLVILRGLVLAARDHTLTRLQVGFSEAQRAKVAQRLVGASWPVVSRLSHARINQVLNGEVQQLGQAAQLLIQIGVSVFTLVVLTGLTFALSPMLAALTFGVLTVGTVTMGPALVRAFSMGSATVAANQHLSWSSSQFLGGLKLAMSQGMHSSFLADFKAGLAVISHRRLQLADQQAARRVVSNAMAAFLAAFVVLIGFGFLNLAPAVIVAMLVLIGRISAPAAILEQSTQTLAQTLPAYARIGTLCAELEAETQPQPAADPDLSLPDGAIEFQKVSFSRGSRAILHGFDLRIEPDAFLGIRGASGVGKTTFADLLVGLYPPRTGRITIGGEPLEGALLTAWRQALSYVPQEPFLLQDTVRQNLLWGARDTSEEAIRDALELTGGDAIVGRLPQGLDTVLGERGTTLSGGERQRIAIARALLRQPRLLILDEATSAIDIVGEQILLVKLRNLSPRPAIIIVAHRHETLNLCADVMTLADGKAAVVPRATGRKRSRHPEQTP